MNKEMISNDFSTKQRNAIKCMSAAKSGCKNTGKVIWVREYHGHWSPGLEILLAVKDT